MSGHEENLTHRARGCEHLYLSGSPSYHQLVAVFAKADLLDAQSGIIAVWIKTAHLCRNTHKVVLQWEKKH